MFDQDALAQAAVGDAQALGRPTPADRLEDGAAGEHQVGAVARRCRGWRRAASKSDVEQARRSPRSTSASLHPQAVDPAAVVARQPEMHAGERRHRAGGAEQVELRGARRRAAASSNVKPSSIASPPRPWPRTLSGVTSTPPCRSASVTTPTGSEVPGPDALGRVGERFGAGPSSQRDLGRAAADVEQHHRSASRVDQRARSRRPPDAPRSAGRRSRASSPVSCRTRATNSAPFSASRQASVATSARPRHVAVLPSCRRQTRSASTVRSIAASLSRLPCRQAPRPAGRCARRRR